MSKQRSDISKANNVTIRDVAQKAGTSIATVSYVLNDKNRYMRPELKEQVINAANELGYVKNAAARSLKGKRRGLLAILVAQFGNSFFTGMCVDIEAVARQEGYVVTICNSYEDPKQEKVILEYLISQRIDGCIICPALSQAENILLLKQYNIPFVVLERSLTEDFPAYDFVGHDNFQTGYLATKKLLDAGHKKIAFLGWDSPIPNVRERTEGYQTALREHGVKNEEHLILLEDLSAQAGERMAQKLPLPEISAIVLGHHEIAKGVFSYLQDKNIRWPDDISIVMIGTPEWSEMLRPNLTCVKRPQQQMGQAAAELLLYKLNNPHQAAEKKLFPSIIIEGRSCRRNQKYTGGNV